MSRYWDDERSRKRIAQASIVAAYGPEDMDVLDALRRANEEGDA